MYKTVLLIDDNPLDNNLNQQTIKNCNLAEKIIVMEDPFVTLRYIKLCLTYFKNIPDIIFVDITMPKMNGFEFIDRLINSAGVLRGTFKIIVLSSTYDPADIELASQSEFIEMFIPKPLTKEALYLLNSKRD